MREIVWDTETTGLDPAEGHRIVEIGAVELVNHLPTGRVYHQYINPERSMPAEAFAVHGIGDEQLRSQPVFRDIAAAFVDFVGDAKLVAHNAEFDMRFINAELRSAGFAPFPMTVVVDTLAIARRKFPGSQASLDALCRRYGVDTSARKKHGALLDSELLAEVYLELCGGRQQGLVLTQATEAATRSADGNRVTVGPRPEPLTPRLTEQEAADHAAFIADLGEAAVWRRVGMPDA